MHAGTATYLTAWAAHHPAGRAINDEPLLTSLGTTSAWVEAKLGIRERRLAGPADTPATLGATALLEACARAGVAPSDLDLLIGATSFDDFDMPAAASRIGGIAETAAFTFDVRAACSGWLVGVQLAATMLATGQARTAAVVATEVTTRRVDPSDRLSVPIFGDAAAATLVSATRPARGLEVVDTAWRSDNSEHDAVVLPNPGTFAQDGPRARVWVEAAIPEVAGDLLERNGLTGSGVRALVCHQANLRVLERLADRLEVPPERHWHNVEWAGNTSAAGAPSSLAAGLDEHGDELADGDPILVVTVGAGVNVVATLLRWVRD